MSIGTWDRVQFLVYLLNLSFAYETWKNNRYAHGGNIVRKIFAWFEGLGPKSLLSKSKNSLELVSSLHNRAKNQFEKVVIGCTNPWPSFILILRKVLKK